MAAFTSLHTTLQRASAPILLELLGHGMIRAQGLFGDFGRSLAQTDSLVQLALRGGVVL